MTLTRPYHIKADNDLQWVLEYKASGDLDALAHLYQAYMPMVYGVALKYFKDENRSKDAVMDIFELLINK
ncbi:sigma-70 family RNA polymerase sigma factor, partial [Pseudoxanthomonas sp. SGD-10]